MQEPLQSLSGIGATEFAQFIFAAERLFAGLWASTNEVTESFLSSLWRPLEILPISLRVGAINFMDIGLVEPEKAPCLPFQFSILALKVSLYRSSSL